VEVVNTKPLEGDDALEVGTVSGDIQLERVGNSHVIAKTVNGSVTMKGPLARAGQYGFTTMSGDVVLTMPADASFRLTAKVSDKSDIDSDFKLKPVSDNSRTPPAKPQPAPEPRTGSPAKGGPVVAPVVVKPPVVAVPYSLRRISMICGDGDATIAVASFGGTLRLKKL
jgi:putative adhesin